MGAFLLFAGLRKASSAVREHLQFGLVRGRYAGVHGSWARRTLLQGFAGTIQESAGRRSILVRKFGQSVRHPVKTP